MHTTTLLPALALLLLATAYTPVCATNHTLVLDATTVTEWAGVFAMARTAQANMGVAFRVMDNVYSATRDQLGPDALRALLLPFPAAENATAARGCDVGLFPLNLTAGNVTTVAQAAARQQIAAFANCIRDRTMPPGFESTLAAIETNLAAAPNTITEALIVPLISAIVELERTDTPLSAASTVTSLLLQLSAGYALRTTTIAAIMVLSHATYPPLEFFDDVEFVAGLGQGGSRVDANTTFWAAAAPQYLFAPLFDELHTETPANNTADYASVAAHPDVARAIATFAHEPSEILFWLECPGGPAIDHIQPGAQTLLAIPSSMLCEHGVSTRGSPLLFDAPDMFAVTPLTDAPFRVDAHLCVRLVPDTAPISGLHVCLHGDSMQCVRGPSAPYGTVTSLRCADISMVYHSATTVALHFYWSVPSGVAPAARGVEVVSASLFAQVL